MSTPQLSLFLLAPTLLAGCFQWDWSPGTLPADAGDNGAMDAGSSDAGPDAGPADAGQADGGAIGPLDAGCTEDHCVSAMNLYLCNAMTLVECSLGCMDGACVLPPDAGAGTWLPCCIDTYIQSCFCAAGAICEMGQFSFEDCSAGRCVMPRGATCPSAG